MTIINERDRVHLPCGHVAARWVVRIWYLPFPTDAWALQAREQTIGATVPATEPRIYKSLGLARKAASQLAAICGGLMFPPKWLSKERTR